MHHLNIKKYFMLFVILIMISTNLTNAFAATELWELIMEDQFLTSSMDAAKWSRIDGLNSVVGGALKVESGSVSINRPLMKNFAVEAKFTKFSSSNNDNYFFISFRKSDLSNNFGVTYRPGGIYCLGTNVSGEKNISTVDASKTLVSDNITTYTYYTRIEMFNGEAKVYMKTLDTDTYSLMGTVTNLAQNDTYVKFSSSNVKFTIDDVKLYKANDFTVQCMTSENVEARPGTKVKLGFSLPPNTSTFDTFGSANITITKGAYNVPFSIGAVDSYNECDLTINEWLDFGSTYNINFSANVLSSFGQTIDLANRTITFKTKPEPILLLEVMGSTYEKKVSDSVYEPVTDLSQGGIIRATFSLRSATVNPVDATIIGASCNGTDDKYTTNNFAKTKTTIPGNDIITPVSIEINVPAGLANPFIKALFWSDFANAKSLVGSTSFRTLH